MLQSAQRRIVLDEAPSRIFGRPTSLGRPNSNVWTLSGYFWPSDSFGLRQRDLVALAWDLPSSTTSLPCRSRVTSRGRVRWRHAEFPKAPGVWFASLLVPLRFHAEHGVQVSRPVNGTKVWDDDRFFGDPAGWDASCIKFDWAVSAQ